MRRSFPIIVVFALVGLMVLTAARAQQSRPRLTTPVAAPWPIPFPSPSPQSDINVDDVIRVSSNLIVVPVSVTDGKDQPVEGLRLQEFRLEEEGQPQEIVQFGDSEQVPLEMAILLDVSGSVKGRFGFEKEAAARFIKSILKPADKAVLYAIDMTPRLVQTRANAEQVAAKLESIQDSESPTAFYDTVVDAANYLVKFTPPQHRRVILVISDGEDTFSENIRSVSATLSAVLRADAILYSINPSGPGIQLDALSTHGQSEMQTLASATGGAAFVPSVPENLDQIFHKIAVELRSQYLLEYYGKCSVPNGTFLHLKVKVPGQPALRIRARQGYYMAQN